jgi:F-type H+-transporting ATPase subunit delta
MSEQAIAHRYAHALFLVAQKRDDIPGTLEDLRGILALLDGDARVGRFFRSPLVRVEHKRELLVSGLEGRVRPWVREFIDLLLRKKRVAYFRPAVAEYAELVEAWQGIQRAEVVSAVPLNGQETRRLHAELERLTGKTVRLEASVDPGLVGGLFVRIGDRVIDRSVRGLLEAMEHRLYTVSV